VPLQHRTKKGLSAVHPQTIVALDDVVGLDAVVDDAVLPDVEVIELLAVVALVEAGVVIGGGAGAPGSTSHVQGKPLAANPWQHAM